ncbi:MAG TPA: matrixin family metalloprotease [Polyangiaceae bacterium]|nr:matrixin family metalloprotease [Polyangiaceae bacterium]
MRTSSRAALFSFAAIFGFSSVLCRPAFAYCRATTCDPTKTSCGDNGHGCYTKGTPIQWKDGTLQLLVDKAGSATLGISGADTQKAVESALSTWMSADCPKGGHPSFTADTELASGLSAEFNENGPNQNVVTYEDDGWPYEPGAVGKTLLAFELDTGDMLDADVVFNSAEFPLAIDPTSSDEIDLEAVLTHEIGHVLGLAHSDVPGATMQPETQGFATAALKTLEADDMAGICAIYPPASKDSSGGASSRPASSSSGDDKDASTEPGPTSSCTVSGGRATDGAFGTALFVAGVALLRRRRKTA